MELVVGARAPELWSTLLRPVDRPAREALELGRAPAMRTAALGAAGIALWSASGLLANGLLGAWGSFDALGGALESLAVALPALIVFGVYLRLDLGPRALLAAQAVGLWTAGLVCVCVLPLLAFLAVMSHGELWALHLRGVLLPVMGLAVATAVPLRILITVDRSARARWLGRAFVSTVAVAFLFKLLLAFPWMLDLSARWN
ncbi:MAG: hypothetical protein JST54_34105 [Deltaproteobacteria bacterium]|nr:hypothetical protein [Deltaproteobacteria bacterium]